MHAIINKIYSPYLHNRKFFMQNLVKQKARKRNIYFYLYVSMFLGSALSVFSASAMFTYEAMQARDRAIQLTLSVCIPNPGHASVVGPLVQDYDDSMYAFNYGRPLSRELSLHVPISGPRQLIKNYSALTAEEQRGFQEKLVDAVYAQNIPDVEDALRKGASVEGPFYGWNNNDRDLFDLIFGSWDDRKKEGSFNIARLMRAEGRKLPSIREVLASESKKMDLLEFLLWHGEKIEEVQLESDLIFAAENLEAKTIKLLLRRGAEIDAAKGSRGRTPKSIINQKAVCNAILNRFEWSFAADLGASGRLFGIPIKQVLKEAVFAGCFDNVDATHIFYTAGCLIKRGLQLREKIMGEAALEVYSSVPAGLIKKYAAPYPTFVLKLRTIELQD